MISPGWARFAVYKDKSYIIHDTYGDSTFEGVCTCFVIFTSSEAYLDDVVDGGVEMKVHVYVKEKQLTTSALGTIMHVEWCELNFVNDRVQNAVNN